jgi:hypothetical protein
MVERLGTDREGLRSELKSFGTEVTWFRTGVKEEEYCAEVV